MYIRSVSGRGERPQQLGQLLRFVHCSATQHIFPPNFGPVRISGQCPAVAKDHSSWVSSCVSFSIQQYNIFHLAFQRYGPVRACVGGVWHWQKAIAATFMLGLGMIRVGQNRIYTPYMTVCMVISLPKIPYIHRIYLLMYACGQP